MNQNMPMMASSAYATSTIPLADVGVAGFQKAQNFAAQNQHQHLANQLKLPQELFPMSNRRLVKVVIVDPNDNIPLDDCVLYSGDEKLTDSTDQELFFEIDIKGILEAHNDKRVKVIDKKVKERTEYLEPAKIRDLKMVVVNIATF